MAVAVLGTGCLASSYRYTDVAASPDEVATRLRDGAREEGLVVESAQGTLVIRELPESAGRPTGETDRANEAAAEQRKPRGRARTIRFAALEEGGTRVETTGEPGPVDALLEAQLGPPSLSYDTTGPGSELLWHEDVVVDYLLSLGAIDLPGQRPSWRADATFRAGPRLARTGGGGDVAAPSLSLSLLGGVGFSTSAHGSWFRPELVLSLDRETIAEPIEGRVLPRGDRYVLDLTLAPLIGLGSTAHGGEVGLAVRHGAWGGFFARVGLIDAGDTEVVWSAGATLGTAPSIWVTAAGLVAGALIAAVAAAASDGLGDTLGGG